MGISQSAGGDFSNTLDVGVDSGNFGEDRLEVVELQAQTCTGVLANLSETQHTEVSYQATSGAAHHPMRLQVGQS